MGKGNSIARVEVAQLETRLAEGVAATTAGHHQGHCGCCNAGIFVTHQSRKQWQPAGTGVSGEAGRNSIFISASKHERYETRTIDKPGIGQCGGDLARVAFDLAVTGSDGDFIGKRVDQIMEHCGHQRPLLLGQSVARIEKEIATNGGQAAGTTRTRGIDRAVCCLGSDRPFLRIHYAMR